ncbi:MAG: type II toxin-antitoxin system RelE/ParE family toxin [Chitinispirillia bacterium]|nr:type II toxin-antitoxin system RelE/ParE family toxin [Chitinispirillia bacterium]
MNSEIKYTEHFKKEYKRLAKKYVSLKDDMLALIKTLRKKPTSGTSLGSNTYKIRLAVSSKGKGKSGGARIITYFVDKDNTVYLLSIYDKSEEAAITDSEIKNILKEVENNK